MTFDLAFDVIIDFKITLPWQTCLLTWSVTELSLSALSAPWRQLRGAVEFFAGADALPSLRQEPDRSPSPVPGGGTAARADWGPRIDVWEMTRKARPFLPVEGKNLFSLSRLCF